MGEQHHILDPMCLFWDGRFVTPVGSSRVDRCAVCRGDLFTIEPLRQRVVALQYVLIATWAAVFVLAVVVFND